MFKTGDYVTRKSYNNDIVFKIIEKSDNKFILKGMEIRLVADAEEKDLEKAAPNRISFDSKYAELSLNDEVLNRNDYFYIPGKILHIDGDSDYLQKCMDFYKKANVPAYGVSIEEKNISSKIKGHLNEIKPNILIITGHDAYYKNKNEYKNSKYFADAVREARKYEKSYENLIIIAGACQSDYESLIKSGSNYASSPEKINIHALDPAIIGASLSHHDKDEAVSLTKLLSKTKYGKEGIGGIKSKGTMYIGYPRKGEK